ncbi:MAG: valine--tRNA ligase [Flavobacteriales bacterium AspAUS03]
METPTRYNPKSTEEKRYTYWLEGRYFYSVPDDKEPYTLVIPPPNVTGMLHMGHMLNNTIQDVLIRRARMRGYNACWVPGTDHASIATEAKIVARLKEEGLSKSDLGREAFLDRAWSWTHKHGGIILEQLKKLGCSCDWDRTKFTMDEELSQAVIKVFVDLYHRGWIYRGHRMVHWDPEVKTTVSDEEVVYEERQGKLYHLRYKVEDEEDFVTIATTRPETILGDTAVCVHPKDWRYAHLKGKKVIVPVVDRVVPIIEDDYVDRTFGTGCLKVTPAHDANDKALADRHGLDFIDIFCDDATLNEKGLHYQGKDRFEVRREIIKELQQLGVLVKVEDYDHKVGLSERTKAVIEPRLSVQWFLKMREIVVPALEAVMDGTIRFYPEKFKNVYRRWMEDVRDWNISRQLWWGHRIPVYYYGKGWEDFVVAETPEEALQVAREKTTNPDLTLGQLRQDLDVLDTWFSSWIWPISVFDGIRYPDNREVSYYYPTQDLVTGPDILFFWVARLIMAGYTFRKERPFTNVYFTGIVRDKQRRKMSKSLGNSPDPIDLMNKYGADAVRVGLLLSTHAGNDLLFDEDLCLKGRNFTNKIWNAFRLIMSWKSDMYIDPSESTQVALEWFQHRFYQALTRVEKAFLTYRISDALMEIYKLIWDDFCAWYLEMIKPTFDEVLPLSVLSETVRWFENLLKLLHPYMPFITEEIWQYLKQRSVREALIITPWPESMSYNAIILDQFEIATQVIGQVRAMRKSQNIPYKELLTLHVLTKNRQDFFNPMILKLAHLSELIYVEEEPKEATFSFLLGIDEYFIPMGQSVNLPAEIEKLQKALHYQQGFLSIVRKKLSNDCFVSSAPTNIVTAERKKESDALQRIQLLEAQLDHLGR